MKIVERLLDDVLVLRADTEPDEAGCTVRFSAKELQTFGISSCFVQDNHSDSATAVLRGLHFQVHKPQGKLIRLLSGRIYDVVVDLRQSSVNFGKHTALEMSADEREFLWVPPGYAHGFYVLEGPATVTYSVTDYRLPEFERTLLWNDPALSIDWPTSQSQPILSEKDRLGTLFVNCDYFD